MAGTINPNPYAPQVKARKAFGVANRSAFKAFAAQRKQIRTSTMATGGAAGAIARRTQLRDLTKQYRGTQKARIGDFRTTTRANFIAAGKPRGGASSGYTDLTKQPTNVGKKPSAAKRSNTQQLLKRAMGTGRNAVK